MLRSSLHEAGRHLTSRRAQCTWSITVVSAKARVPIMNSSAQPLAVADVAGAEAGYLDPALWTRLAEAGEPADFAAAWLAIQCTLLAGTRQGVVVLRTGDGGFAPVATWRPDQAVGSLLGGAAELALERRRGAVRSGRGDDGVAIDALAYPVLVNGEPQGVAALEIAHSSDGALTAAMRRLQWGCAWLELRQCRQAGGQSGGELARVLDLAAAALQPAVFQTAATGLATELAAELDCEWVAIGFVKGRHVRVRALSHSAEFDRRTGLMRAVAAAMEEAIDQQDMLVFPESAERPPAIVRAHAELAEQQGLGALCTLPFGDADALAGAILLARRGGAPFTGAEQALAGHVATQAGPVLETKRRDDRWIGAKLGDSVTGAAGRLLGRGHIGWKLGALLLACVVAFLAVARGEYRVRAPAELEGIVQRALTAPIDGYVAEANVRAGDRIATGDPLFALEDKDLRLERLRLDSEREKLEREYSRALADGDRAQVRILAARIDQAAARIALVDEQLARTRVAAPFDGFVVSGDLSQSLGAPVTRGDILFELAPLDAYRVRLLVDERDITRVQVGQQGTLALTGLPQQPLPMRVAKITPVSETDAGRNVFVVEGMLEETPPALRPGMEGVGKIDIDRRRLLWIWTHRLVHWARLWAWTWLP